MVLLIVLAAGLLLLWAMQNPAARLAASIGGCFAAAVLLYCVFRAPQRFAPSRPASSLEGVDDAAERLRLEDERAKLQNDVRTALVQAIGGAALLVGIFFTWQQLQTNRQQVSDQLELTRQGQVADRFTRAVDQLGSDRPEVKLGGIYGLEAIAKQSGDERLTVFEVLSAYIRKHAPWRPKTAGEDGVQPSFASSLQDRAPDVQAALAVLARRSVLSTDPPLMLDHVDLQQAALPGAHLQRASLADANLQEADLIQANLQGASLGDANLQWAFLGDANTQGANFVDANLQHANLDGANLQGASLSGANLKEASLIGANLQGMSIDGVDLRRAHLHGANLEGVILLDADLRQANLDGANLQDAILGDVDFRGATANAATRWPPDFDWRAAGIKLSG